VHVKLLIRLVFSFRHRESYCRWPGSTAYLQNNTSGLLYSMLLNGPVGDKYGFSIAKYVGKRSSTCCVRDKLLSVMI